MHPHSAFKPLKKPGAVAASTLSLLAIFACVALSGCSQEARKEYSDAGSNAATALKDTGQAIGADAKVVKHSISESTKHGGNESDHVSASVKQSLETTPNLQITNLKVETNDGNVTLTGGVPTMIQKERAEHVAKAVVGSAFVIDNQLEIGAGS